MHAISSYRGKDPQTNKHTHTQTHTHTHTETGPITIHCTGASTQCIVIVPPNFMKFDIRGQLTDVITCVKFLANRFRGYRVLSFWHPRLLFPINLLHRPYLHSDGLPPKSRRSVVSIGLRVRYKYNKKHSRSGLAWIRLRADRGLWRSTKFRTTISLDVCKILSRSVEICQYEGQKPVLE